MSRGDVGENRRGGCTSSEPQADIGNCSWLVISLGSWEADEPAEFKWFWYSVQKAV